MTQLRKNANSITNYFDRLTRGIGKAGSSFMDIDTCVICTHDGRTKRFLFQELKTASDELTTAQFVTMFCLADLPGVSAWFCQRLPDGNIEWADFYQNKLPLRTAIVSEAEYTGKFRAWWGNARAVRLLHWSERVAHDPSLRNFVEAEIARAHVELKALRAECERQRSALVALQRANQRRKSA